MIASQTTSNREALEHFGQARFVVAACWPFLTGAVMRLCPRWSDDVDTMGVDKHWRLYMNPRWVAKHHPAMLALILAGHELQHALGNHGIRLSDMRDVWLETQDGQRLSLANIAHDLAINSGLQSFVDSGNNYQSFVGRKSTDRIPLALPKEAIYPSSFVDKRGQPFPKGKISEEYAELLISEAKNVMVCSGPNGSGNGKGKNKAACGRCGSGGGGIKEEYEEESEPDTNDPNTGVSEAEREVLRQQTALAIREQSSRMRGTVPGGMEQWADIRLTPSKQPWQRILTRHVRLSTNRLMGMHDYSYAVLNRRHQGSDIIIPGLYKPEPKFILVMDTSGSMSVNDYSEAFGHIAAILDTVGFKKVPVLACDAACAEVQWITDLRQVKLIGGGGTDMRVAIDRAAELKYGLIIVLSDGETPWPMDKPRGVQQVIACLTRTPYTLPPSWIKTIIQE